MPALNLKSTLLIAIGNDGRGDDGLGWAFGQWLEKEGGFRGRVEYRYQLQVEDAEMISRAGAVIFVDASHQPLPAGHQWSDCKAEGDYYFTTHELAPGAILQLARILYGSKMPAYLLALEGESWELEKGFSRQAEQNLEAAKEWWRKKIEQ